MIDQIILIIFTLIALLVMTYVIPILKSKIGVDKYELLLTYIEYAIRSAEQIYAINEGTKKKEYVLEYIRKKSDQLLTGLKEDDLNVLIEGVVNDVKYGQ